MTISEQHKSAVRAVFGVSLILAMLCPECGQAAETARTEVVVLSTLHQLHDQIEGYSFVDLSNAIEQFDPDILAVELTAADLESRRDQAVKQEYQRSVFPLLEEHNYVVVPLEPSQPLFDELVGLIREAQSNLSEQRPDVAEAFGIYVDSLYQVLREQWTSIEAVNSRETDVLFESKHRYQNAIFGPQEAQGWERWNQHFLQQIRAAANTNPGARIVVLVGAEHAYWLRAQLESSDLVLLDAGQQLGGRRGRSQTNSPQN